jgi:hypothetical protein
MIIRELNSEEQFPQHPFEDRLTSIADDPIRPELPLDFRIASNRHIYTNEGAIVCMAWCNDVPTTIAEMTMMSTNMWPPDYRKKDVAVFYTVWSYTRGAGKDLIVNLFDMLSNELPNSKYVTLSPKTEMAKKFHTKNGAKLLNENVSSYNFEYETKPMRRSATI